MKQSEKEQHFLSIAKEMSGAVQGTTDSLPLFIHPSMKKTTFLGQNGNILWSLVSLRRGK